VSGLCEQCGEVHADPVPCDPDAGFDDGPAGCAVCSDQDCPDYGRFPCEPSCPTGRFE
jgi:hypothetical protein